MVNHCTSYFAVCGRKRKREALVESRDRISPATGISGLIYFFPLVLINILIIALRSNRCIRFAFSVPFALDVVVVEADSGTTSYSPDGQYDYPFAQLVQDFPGNCLDTKMAETEPIIMQGIEPSSGESHSPPGDRHITATWGSKDGSISNRQWNDVEANRLPEKVVVLESKGMINQDHPRKRIVVVGFGMVGIAFM